MSTLDLILQIVLLPVCLLVLIESEVTMNVGALLGSVAMVLTRTAPSPGWVVSEDIEPSAEEVILELGGEEGETVDDGTESEAGPFDQTVILGGAVFTVTAPVGVASEGSTLKAEVIDSESADRAVEAAVGEADIDG